MRFLIIFCLLISTAAYANCDIEPLKKEIISQYKTILPVHNEKGEIGHARAKNFVVADYLMKMKDESLLIANFELDIKWLKGNKQSVKTLVVARVNEKSCSIDSYETGDTLGSSLTAKD